jgi:hypothetical protein
MGANFPRVKTWTTTEDVTATDLNAEFDNILNNLTAANVDDFSANVSQMQSTVDPGEVGTESLATSVAGEIQRLRKLILEITGEDEWYESPVASIISLANSIGTGLTANRIVSGAVRSAGTNEMPVFLKAAGTATTVSVQGSTTNFIYYVNGSEYTMSTNVTLTGLTAAPSSNNTCLVNDAQAADSAYTKHTGEDGSVITVDAMGTEIQALVGKYAAFKVAGVADEYFIAYVESTTTLSKAFRGYFFDSTNTPVARTAYTDNDTITLMKLTWVFAKSDGTLTATYTNPIWSKDEPSSPALGDYWFDLANNTWKVYGVGAYASANAHLIGACIQDATNTVASRSFEFFSGYEDTNTLELFYNSATAVQSRYPGAIVNVWGQTIKSDRNLRTWDITIDRDTGVSETSSTYYYAYLTQVGDVIISDVKPYDRREDLLGYYHPHASWRCVGRFFNGSGSDISATSVNSYFSRYNQLPLREEAASTKVEILDKVIKLSGASASEYLPPAAKTKGQEFVIVHNGTSLSQVYTLTTFGAETFSINGSTTAGMYTNGEVFRLLSDGTGYLCLSHHAKTDLIDAGTMTIGAVTTPPTKGSTTRDKVFWMRDGKFSTLTYQMQNAGSANGTGDYLYSLVTNMTADTTAYELNTGVVGADATHRSTLPTFYGSMYSAAGPVAGAIGPAVLYTNTQFRVMMTQWFATGFTFHGSAFYGLAAARGYAFSLRIPISGWLP